MYTYRRSEKKDTETKIILSKRLTDKPLITGQIHEMTKSRDKRTGGTQKNDSGTAQIYHSNCKSRIYE